MMCVNGVCGRLGVVRVRMEEGRECVSVCEQYLDILKCMTVRMKESVVVCVWVYDTT